ncbi:uncharacterized protein LOC144432975 [Glandiceps talaboti]
MASETEIHGEKRKRDETSESASSPFSYPRYKLRQTTSTGCIFGGIKSSNTATSPGRNRTCGSSTTTSDGPSTSTTNIWGPAHYKRLNFNVIDLYSLTEAYYFGNDAFKRKIQEPMIECLFWPLPLGKFDVNPGTEIPAPNVVDDAFVETIKEVCSGTDPVILYVDNLAEDLKSHGFEYASEEKNERLEAYLFCSFIDEGLLEPATAKHIKDLVRELFEICAMDSEDLELDKIIENMLDLILWKEGNLKIAGYHILITNATRYCFEVCGAKVASETNVLLAYSMRTTLRGIKEEGIPLVLSENKSGHHEKGKASKLTSSRSRSRSHKETQANKGVHKNISQVIRQCLSVADKSPYETDDFKIVYHVSLMDTSHVILTRTHIAKSTLRVMKDGCGIPNQHDLNPSHTFESSFEVNNNPILCFKVLYLAFSYLFKLAQPKVGHTV